MAGSTFKPFALATALKQGYSLKSTFEGNSPIQVGDAEPARNLGQDTLQRCRRAFGPDHPITQYLTETAGISHPMPGGDAAADGPSRSS